MLRTDEPLAVAAVAAIHSGDVELLQQLLQEHSGLATARLGDPNKGNGMSRTLLHVATDWPGHFPNRAKTVAALIAAGADVNAQFTGPHAETPLHWAASSDDVTVLDALLAAGADINWIGYDRLTPLDAARRSGAAALVQWLASRGATSAKDIA